MFEPSNQKEMTEFSCFMGRTELDEGVLLVRQYHGLSAFFLFLFSLMFGWVVFFVRVPSLLMWMCAVCGVILFGAFVNALYSTGWMRYDVAQGQVELDRRSLAGRYSYGGPNEENLRLEIRRASSDESDDSGFFQVMLLFEREQTRIPFLLANANSAGDAEEKAGKWRRDLAL